MGIRICASLYEAFKLEGEPIEVFKQFMGHLLKIDVQFVMTMIKQKLKRGKTE